MREGSSGVGEAEEIGGGTVGRQSVLLVPSSAEI